MKYEKNNNFLKPYSKKHPRPRIKPCWINIPDDETAENLITELRIIGLSQQYQPHWHSLSPGIPKYILITNSGIYPYTQEQYNGSLNKTNPHRTLRNIKNELRQNNYI